MRLKLAIRERRKLVCSPLDEPLASNRVSDSLHAQFSWLKTQSVMPMPEPLNEQPVRKPARAPERNGRAALAIARSIPRQSMFSFIVVSCQLLVVSCSWLRASCRGLRFA